MVSLTLFFLLLPLFFFGLVLLKADFPFAQVPVPNVTYLDDREIKITLKCDFQVPPWGNVSFEVQWYVNGRGLGPVHCDNPNASQCAHLRSSNYPLGSYVRQFHFFHHHHYYYRIKKWSIKYNLIG